MQIIYDHHFNLNEWFVIGLTFIGYLLFFILKKRFAWQKNLTFLMLGIFGGHFFDHTISLPPFDFYDVNDSNAYEFMDFLTYFMFGPFSYFFIYYYDKLINDTRYTTLYIMMWSTAAIAFEYLGHMIGLYHYKNGYKFFYSLSIYILFLSIVIFIFYLVKRSERHNIKEDNKNI
jgi:hypothetical protein